MIGAILCFLFGTLAGLAWGWWIFAGAPQRRDRDALLVLQATATAYLARHDLGDRGSPAALTIHKDGGIEVWDTPDLQDRRESGSAS